LSYSNIIGNGIIKNIAFLHNYPTLVPPCLL
jgi:hypothetical protein